MKGTVYLSKPSQAHSRSARTYTKVLLGVMAFFMMMLSTVALVGNKPATASAEDPFDPIQWVICQWDEDTMARRGYQVAMTDDLPFQLRSKSSISTGRTDIDSILNGILQFSGNDFVSTNEAILGYRLEEMNPDDEEAPQGELGFNGGVTVNPYDRFGVAGLTFSGYAGEWKYVIVDACRPSQAMDPKTGLYYEERLVPLSTWSDIGTSKDVRTRQFDLGFLSTFGSSVMNTVSNAIFSITKVIVVITIALINFAFSDIVGLLGITDMIGGDDPGTGVFGKLLSGIFWPLIVMIFVFTALHIFWRGAVKREFRGSMVSLIRSIAMFFFAVVVAANPIMWVKLPNQVASTIQAVMVETLNTNLSGGNGLCATSIGRTSIGLTDGAPREIWDDPISNIQYLEQASKNMSSAIGCSLWQQYLFRPWAQAQFGTDWNNLWDKEIPEWARENPTSIKNNHNNSEMVGDAAVPLGGGEVLHNWALFHVSTQTNVHAPFGKEAEPSKYTAGIANDWWRIVDAFSNYSETERIIEIPGPSEGDPPTEETYVEPNIDPDDETTLPLEQWDMWTGNSPFARLMVVISSLLVAVIGVIAPLIFAALSAIYSIGIEILMAFMPIMLLLGCWADRGWEIFKAWGTLVVNTVLKRIMVGLLLVLAIILSSTAIRIMETESWWQGVILMALLSMILISSREKIVDTVASVRWSALDFTQGAKKVTEGVEMTGKLTAMGAVGGVAGKTAGGTFTSGAISGMKNEFKNLSYRNQALRPARQTYETLSKRDMRRMEEHHCGVCGEPIDKGSLVFETSNGEFLCTHCGEGYDDPGLREFYLDQDYNTKRQNVISKDAAIVSTVAQGEGKERLKENVKKVTTDNPDVSYEEKKDALKRAATTTNDDIALVREKRLHSARQVYPEPPKEIASYLDIDLINEAWYKGNYDYVRMAYTVGWANWFIDTISEETTNTLEKLKVDLENEHNAEKLATELYTHVEQDSPDGRGS